VRFTYTPNFRDNFHGVLYGFWGTRKAAIRSALFGLLFGTLFLFVLWNLELPRLVLLFLVLAASALWIALFTLGAGAWLAALVTRRQRAMGPVEVVVSDELLRRRQGSTSVEQLWSGVSWVKETNRAFLMFDGDRPIFSIEKSCVPTSSDLGRLRQYLREKKPGQYEDA
jgi:hypothetical protein